MASVLRNWILDLFHFNSFKIKEPHVARGYPSWTERVDQEPYMKGEFSEAHSGGRRQGPSVEEPD